MVLGIKCDQSYEKNIRDLYKILFETISSIQDLAMRIAVSGKRCIILLDQLDALSQTLSSDRTFLTSYVRFIEELLTLKNIRIIISSRSYDLQFDADLKRYNDNNDIKKIEVNHLSNEDVQSVLKTLNVDHSNSPLVDLLTVPYNLELFTKIPEVNLLLKKDRTITISKIYDELWKQVIANKNYRITDCLDLIITQMYEITPNLVSESSLLEFTEEVEYLLSHNILNKNLDKLSFFHQSFYEYYLARWFVSSDRNLIEYIFEEDQNLYIRSLIKTVIEYLREANHRKYINLYKKILSNNSIRFHIKYLFIVQLGNVEIPSKKEQLLLVDDILPDYSVIFIEVVNSKGWLNIILDNDLLVGSEGEIYNMLYRNVNHNSNAIFKYVERSSFSSKNEMIKGLIPCVENWNEELLTLFDQYYSYSKETELWYFYTLKKIAASNITFVFIKLQPVLLIVREKNERIKFDYRYEKLIDLLYQIDDKRTCEFLLNVQLEMLEETKYDYFQNFSTISSPLLKSSAYDLLFRYSDESDARSLDYYLIKFYKDCDFECFASFFNLNKNCNYVPLLTTIAKVLKDRNDKPTKQIIEFLLIVDSKEGLKGPDDFFQLTLRRLIASIITYLNEEQYISVIYIINRISHPFEINFRTENSKRVYSLRIGQKKYLFIKALPNEIINKDKRLWQEFKMLERKFGNLNHNKPLHGSSSRSGIVGPPLPNANYDKLSNKGWLVSMKIIDDNYESKDFLAGGLVEHARVFENRVSQNPDQFYSLIEQLYSEDVSHAYISYGISGLIKCKFNPQKVSDLIHRYILLDLKSEYHLYTIWNMDYLLHNGIFTDAMFHYFISIIKSEQTISDVFNPDYPLNDFINTVRGAACHKLFMLTDYAEYEEQVFAIIEYLVDPVNNSSNTILCGIMANLGYLNRWNIERSFGIFKDLVKYHQKIILKHSINTGQYFNNSYHGQMQFYFDELMKYPDLYKECYVFVNSWLLESINDYSMYDNFLFLGEDAVNCALTVAEEFLICENEVNLRALEIIQRCLAFKYESLSHQFSSIVLRKFKPKDFNILKSFITSYINTHHFSQDPRYLLLYLTECTGQYPLDCLEIINEVIIPENVDISKRGYLGDEPLVLILAIYSKLQQGSLRYMKERKVALDTFDRMLELPAIRSKAINALENVLN